MNITDWAPEDRPREKMERYGASRLTNAELLALLISSGSDQENAVDLMKRILADCNNNLNTLGKLTLHDLTTYHGIGPAKACELGKRRQIQTAEERADLGSATAIYNYMHPRLQDLDVEEAWALLLNRNYKLIKPLLLSHGGITETAIDVRVLLREALLNHATIIALCHNHPSNNATPSSQDDRLTQAIQRACETLRIYLLDHLIITDGQYYSYREEGRIL